MKDEDIDKIFAAADAAFKPMGYERFDEALGDIAAQLSQLAEAVATHKDRAQLRELLRTAPDVDPASMTEIMEKLPMAFYMFRKTALQDIKEFPHAPGGRPKLAIQEKQGQICQDIGDLIVKGVPLRAAYRRIGQRYGASARTIQRIWNQRKKEQPEQAEEPEQPAQLQAGEPEQTPGGQQAEPQLEQAEQSGEPEKPEGPEKPYEPEHHE